MWTDQVRGRTQITSPLIPRCCLRCSASSNCLSGGRRPACTQVKLAPAATCGVCLSPLLCLLSVWDRTCTVAGISKRVPIAIAIRTDACTHACCSHEVQFYPRSSMRAPSIHPSMPTMQPCHMHASLCHEFICQQLPGFGAASIPATRVRILAALRQWVPPLMPSVVGSMCMSASCSCLSICFVLHHECEGG